MKNYRILQIHNFYQIPGGEDVLAFASAEAFSTEGSLLDMTFQNTGLQPGDSTNIEVKVEELALDGAVVETENGTGTICMKERGLIRWQQSI